MNPNSFKGYKMSWTIPANNPRGFANIAMTNLSAKAELTEALIEEHLKTDSFADAQEVIARIKAQL